jgi:glycosyltransferase involved in cell wall biosynthesis
MRIAFCWSGVSGYMGACWRALARDADTQVKVFARPASGDYEFDDRTMHGIDWIRLRDNQLRNANSLHAMLSAFSPHAVVLSGWSNPAYRRLTTLPWRSRPRFVMTMDTQWRGTLKQRLAPILLGPFLRRLDGVIVPGQRGVRAAERLGIATSRISTGMLGFDGSEMEAAHRARQANWPKAFLFVGRYISLKGIDVLVEAYDRYRRMSSAPWALKCCGSGRLSSLIKGREGIVDCGFVQPRDLPTVWSQAGCFVFPSKFEAWGVALAEACGSGLPVICSRAVGATDDLVEENVNGFLVSSGDARGLAGRMHWVERNAHRLPAMGDASRALAARFEAENWAKTLIQNLAPLAQH